MNEKGATNLSDLLVQAGTEPEAGPSAKYLILLRGGIPGAMLRLSPGGDWIGRAPENTVYVPEGTVSRRHAALRSDGDGRVWLTDLGSTNGTFVNGRRLVPHQPVLLRDGDRLRFGTTVVVKFVCPDPCEERFQRELFERSVRDPLTGLYNRNFFLDQIGPLSARAAARGLGLAILMLDLDHFKVVNDTYGHAAGDTVLHEAAQVIRQSTRADDLVARYGGEEFVAALPITALDHAFERAERIRLNLSARRIEASGTPLCITVSIGLAYAPPERAHLAASLLVVADRCLYRAKETGRDRVVGRFEPALSWAELQATSDGEGSGFVCCITSPTLGAQDD
ncbi:MAG: GGDEF domain-containing protein [Isosphaeraceae bacterium]|nr:GGDEF domain-containing protein [Isosphaeraceae bacterium]